MSLYDFYMYLKHVEFSDENLEFYMWCVRLSLLSSSSLLFASMMRPDSSQV